MKKNEIDSNIENEIDIQTPMLIETNINQINSNENENEQILPTNTEIKQIELIPSVRQQYNSYIKQIETLQYESSPLPLLRSVASNSFSSCHVNIDSKWKQKIKQFLPETSLIVYSPSITATTATTATANTATTATATTATTAATCAAACTSSASPSSCSSAIVIPSDSEMKSSSVFTNSSNVVPSNNEFPPAGAPPICTVDVEVSSTVSTCEHELDTKMKSIANSQPIDRDQQQQHEKQFSQSEQKLNENEQPLLNPFEMLLSNELECTPAASASTSSEDPNDEPETQTIRKSTKRKRASTRGQPRSRARGKAKSNTKNKRR
jgi:hypothetical protein